MSKNKLMPTVVLSSICICVVALLALINLFTAPIIKANQEKKLQEALLEVMPDGGSFVEVENLTGLPETVTKVFCSETRGYVFQIKAKGFKTGMVIVCGIDKDGHITGSKCIKSQETNGAENILPEKYVGKTLSDYANVEIIANSTKTSDGYKAAITDAFDAFNSLISRSVDHFTIGGNE